MWTQQGQHGPENISNPYQARGMDDTTQGMFVHIQGRLLKTESTKSHFSLKGLEITRKHGSPVIF